MLDYLNKAFFSWFGNTFVQRYNLYSNYIFSIVFSFSLSVAIYFCMQIQSATSLCIMMSISQQLESSVSLGCCQFGVASLESLALCHQFSIAGLALLARCYQFSIAGLALPARCHQLGVISSASTVRHRQLGVTSSASLVWHCQLVKLAQHRQLGVASSVLLDRCHQYGVASYPVLRRRGVASQRSRQPQLSRPAGAESRRRRTFHSIESSPFVQQQTKKRTRISRMVLYL